MNIADHAGRLRFIPLLGLLGVLLCCGCRFVDDPQANDADVSGSVAPAKEAALPVFPGAQGFGIKTIAGRGGRILKVTNLNDAGAGSLRQAVQASGARIIVFEVGGEIHLETQLHISKPYMTIAGQTAPPPGITLTGTGMKIETNDILIQHIFVRHTASDGTDAIDVRSGIAPLFNIVIDHVSISWGDDENLSFNPGPDNTLANNATFSNNLIAEANGRAGSHNYGTLIAAGTKNFSLVGNLWMSHKERQPRINGLVNANLVNNLSYNIGTTANMVVGSSHGPNLLTIAGNLYIAGPDTPPGASAVRVTKDISPGSQICMLDNGSDETIISASMRRFLVDIPPVPLDNITVMPVQEVEPWLLAKVGARPGERDGIIDNALGDEIDERLIGEVRSRTGSQKLQPPALPRFRSTFRKLELPAAPNGDDDGDGYTNIEEMLHDMAARVEGPG